MPKKAAVEGGGIPQQKTLKKENTLAMPSRYRQLVQRIYGKPWYIYLVATLVLVCLVVGGVTLFKVATNRLPVDSNQIPPEAIKTKPVTYNPLNESVLRKDHYRALSNESDIDDMYVLTSGAKMKMPDDLFNKIYQRPTQVTSAQSYLKKQPVIVYLDRSANPDKKQVVIYQYGSEKGKYLNQLYAKIKPFEGAGNHLTDQVFGGDQAFYVTPTSYGSWLQKTPAFNVFFASKEREGNPVQFADQVLLTKPFDQPGGAIDAIDRLIEKSGGQDALDSLIVGVVQREHPQGYLEAQNYLKQLSEEGVISSYKLITPSRVVKDGQEEAIESCYRFAILLLI